ncbi:MAG: ATP-dependent 6-phosphofructokinase [Candidatus Ventricola sp.]|nr:ATP-dependent 6-phosphofructokinase [Candidatus Ventricola sp.]
MRRIGVLTSGGDAPGMNAAVMAVAKAARYNGMTLVGIKRGYNGALNIEQNGMAELDLDTVLDIADQPGTYLRTARCLEFLDPQMQQQAAKNIRDMGIEGVIVIGGDGSFKGAQALCNLGVPCIGIPGTIDNDLPYTEMTLGYDSAVNSCVEAIRAIRATSRSHDRPAVVEVMGRHCGDIALKAAAGTGAEICIVPEVEWSIPAVADRLSHLIAEGNPRATVVIAEGAFDAMQEYDWKKVLREHNLPVHDDDTISTRFLTRVLRCLTGCEARTTVLGYIQRGRQPSAYDSWFAFEAGNMAVNLLRNGISNQVIGIKYGRVFCLPIHMALKNKREFNRDLYDMINEL